MEAPIGSDNLIDLAKRVTSPEGYQRLLKKLEEQVNLLKRSEKDLMGEIRAREIQVERTRGSLQAMEAVVETVKAFAANMGIDKVLTQPEVAAANPAVLETPTTTVTPETQAKIDNGICLFVSRVMVGGKAIKKGCVRKLRSKEEKEKGYCKVHIDVVEGRKPDPEEK